MNRYELAIATADWLEKTPQQYAFSVGVVPDVGRDPEAQRCLLGEMGILTGMRGVPVGRVAEQHLGMREDAFYQRMSYHYNGAKEFLWGQVRGRWMWSASIAAITLRKLADKELRLPKPEIQGGYPPAMRPGVEYRYSGPQMFDRLQREALYRWR